MKNYAFIFARGGSKGLPGKNIKPLAGKPLLEYSIETAKACSSISKIFVSTDDSNIATVAIGAGAELIERPAELAKDSSVEWYAWRHAINWVHNKYGDFDHFVSLPATSPLRSVEDVESSLVHLEASSADICISVTPAGRNPFFNMVVRTQQDTVELVSKPEGEVTRRQDAPEVFDIATVVYTTKPQFVLDYYGIFSGKVTSIEVPKHRAVDIDDIYDFKLAEAIVMNNG